MHRGEWPGRPVFHRWRDTDRVVSQFPVHRPGSNRRDRQGKHGGIRRPGHAVSPRAGEVSNLSPPRRPEAPPAGHPLAAADQLLPGPVTFEWSGSDRLRYSIRVRGPQGALWEQAHLPPQPLTYPETAPALRDSVPYTWDLQTKGHPVQRAQFELLPASEAARIQEALALLQPDPLGGAPTNTIVLLRAGLFFGEGLYQEA